MKNNRKGNDYFGRILFTKQKESAIIAKLNPCTGGSMDRASDSGSEGWGFESLPVYQIKEEDTHTGILFFYLALRAGKGLERSNRNMPAYD